MRLTITKKIVLAVIGIVILCVGTMAWITSQNLQRGFIAYLNELQAQDLEKLRDQLAQHYRESGSLEYFRRNPRALHDLMNRINRRAVPDNNDDPPPRADGRPQWRFDRRPAAPPHPQNRPPPDPLGFGPRLSLLDQDGRPLIGPPDPPPGMVRAITVDGQTIGTLSLQPMRQIGSGSDASFIRGQIRDILWLAAALMGIAMLLAIWLARQLLRPIAGLRSVTQSIALGQFDARAPVLNRDELSDLARHVNAMAQALELGERQRRRMLADISHELRTPLSVIRGEIEALIDGIRQADPRALDSLHAEVLRLNKLVDDLHQIALADAGDLHYQKQTLDLGALLQSVLGRFRARAESAGLTVTAALPQQQVWVQADPDRLTQVIANLLENSVRYTDSGGTINCAIAVPNDRVELTIEDSAPGVAPGLYERLFERLYRVDAARGRDRGGSGLGLSICKVLVEAQGGAIRAMPSPLGGIKILVQLPLARAPA